MTDQSRVEAVARALCAEEGRDPDVWYLADDAHRQSWCLFKSRAQAAIEANDAWLGANIWPLAKNLEWRLSGSDGRIGDWEPMTVARAAVQSLGKPEPTAELKRAESSD